MCEVLQMVPPVAMFIICGITGLRKVVQPRRKDRRGSAEKELNGDGWPNSSFCSDFGNDRLQLGAKPGPVRILDRDDSGHQVIRQSVLTVAEGSQPFGHQSLDCFVRYRRLLHWKIIGSDETLRNRGQIPEPSIRLAIFNREIRDRLLAAIREK